MSLAYYAPIQIKRKPQTVHWQETKTYGQEDSLSLALLRPFVGPDCFDIEPNSYNGYDVTAYRTRPENREEVAARVAKEEAYMAEYRRRQALKNNK